MTFTRALSTNNYGPMKFIVDGTTPANGTHSTISSALTSAVSGDTIFIRPGTYTENLTLKAGVNLCANTCDALTPNVTISGTCTFTSGGTVSISGIRLQTNSAALLSVTGSAASIVNLNDCYLNCTNATGISYTSSSSNSSINIANCKGDLGTTGIGLFSSSSAGQINFQNSQFSNSGGSSTASTISAGSINAFYSIFIFPISTSGTATISINFSIINTSAQSVIAFTHNGTGANSRMGDNLIASGSAAAISVGTGATLTFVQNEVSSSNATAVITGAGSIFYSPVNFSGSGKIISTTTQTPINFGTWTPTLAGDGVAGTTTYTLQVGYYTIIGNLVYVEGQMVITSATGTGNALIGGLPFTVKSLASYTPRGNISLSSGAWAWTGTGTQLVLFLSPSSKNALVESLKSTGAAFLTMTNGSASFNFNAWYQI
jgi:hypothetical protein